MLAVPDRKSKNRRASKRTAPASARDAPVHVRFNVRQLDKINRASAKLGIPRANLLAAWLLSEIVEWQPEVEPIRSEDEWIPVTVRIPARAHELLEEQMKDSPFRARSEYVRMLISRHFDKDDQG